MQERSTTHTRASFTDYADQPAPLLVCFSHLRWDFVWQRPQHLLSRVAKHYRVLVIEEPIFKPSATPHMEISHRPGGITIAAPVLPEGLDTAEVILEQRDLVDALLAREPEGTARIFWYYTPMALAFSSHLESDLTVYDNMDELSAFRGASPELLALEEALFARADLVFTGGMSLYGLSAVVTAAFTPSRPASISSTSPRRAPGSPIRRTKLRSGAHASAFSV
jgi:hypothetical protein